MKKELDFAALHMAEQGFDGLIKHQESFLCGVSGVQSQCNDKLDRLLNGFALGGFAGP